VITTTYRLITRKEGAAVASTVQNRCTVTTGGAVDVEVLFHINENLHFIPRSGMEFVLPAGFEKLTYYGLGDNENYSDRRMSAVMGVHESTVSKQHFPFVPPSECGGHGQTRWLSLADEAGHRITFTGYVPFHFDARHNSITDYQAAKHDHELPARAETWLHIDASHSGIGSDMAWSSVVNPEHLTKAGAHWLRFAVQVD